MALSSTLLHISFSTTSPLFLQNNKISGRIISTRSPLITAVKSSEPPQSAEPQPKTKQVPKKPVYSMKKGQIVRVDKEKYLNSINAIHLTTKALITYTKTGERVLDLRVFETGEYALIAWVGIPTAPAWLPTDMLIKSDKLDYERI
ncbi:hypothetical protein CASFOL_034979 [Castilleja foliolosa]|uniref:NADH dehydrogenase-like complex O n=1 Tax=Castilleja foliolosa TaxID=1961234 RepID=A0ABD3BS33_9LAMI